MEDKGLLIYIWTNRLNRAIIVSVGLIVSAGILIKFLVWEKLAAAPFVFFGLAIPAMIIWINFIPYTFHKEWTQILLDYSDSSELRKNVKVYIKNFWPWSPRLFKVENATLAFKMPNYDFDKADILHSPDLIIIYGQTDNLMPFLRRRTRPFAIPLRDTQTLDSKLYLVKLTSLKETTQFKELCFLDYIIGKENPMTIRIYNDSNERQHSV
jgi:hypothetical protein